MVLSCGWVPFSLGPVASAALLSTTGGQPRFSSTQWGELLLAAGHGEGEDLRADPAPARAALGDFYGTYRHPVYAFLRRRGHGREDAQDLTQDFFVHLMEEGTLRRADPCRGRFRTFLLGALERFLCDVRNRAGARKRGGGCQFIHLDDDTAETGYQLSAPEAHTPERLFETRWAAALVEATLARLHEEMAAGGHGARFEALRDYVVGSEDATYQTTAESLGLSLGALKSAIHRLRARYAALLREEVARTVVNRSDVDEEVRHLRATLRGNG